MSIGIQVDQRVPLIIKKDLLSALLRIPDLLRKLMENFLQRLPRVRCSKAQKAQTNLIKWYDLN